MDKKTRNIRGFVNQLEKSEDSIVEFSKAIGRVLKKYIIKEQYKTSKKIYISMNVHSIIAMHSR